MPLSQYHPLNDPRLKERKPNPSNPANDPMFLANVIEEMEEDEQLREFVHKSFEEGNLSWMWHDAQREMNKIISLDLAEFLIFCSRQLGKSFFILSKAIEHCAHKFNGRRSLVRIFCTTQKQVTDIVQDNMQLIQELAPVGYIKRTKSENRWYVGVGEIRVGMMSSAHVHGKRGGNATLIITEEGCFMPSDDFKNAVQNILSPQLLRSKGKLIHVTTASEDEQHYIQKVVKPKAELNGTFINLTIYSNPQLEEEQIIRAYELIEDGTDEGWRREYLCEIIRSTNLVAIPAFDKTIHVGKLEHKDWYQYLVAGDFGGVRDLYCFHLLAYDHELMKVVVLEEKSFPSRTSTTEVVSSLREWDIYTTSRVIDCPTQTMIDMASLEEAYAIMNPIKDKFEDTLKFIRDEYFRNRVISDEKCMLLNTTADSQMLNKQKTDWERNEATGHGDAIMSLVYGLRSVDRITDKRPRPNPENVWIPNHKTNSMEERLKQLAFNK